MALTGHIFKVTNVLATFLPVILGEDIPSDGFSPTQALLDLGLQSWDIKVGSSTDIFKTAGDVW